MANSKVRQEGLFGAGADPRMELIDLEDSVRHWKVHVHRAAPANTEPFHVFAAIEFEWRPVDAARAHTCEEGVLLTRAARTDGETAFMPPIVLNLLKQYKEMAPEVLTCADQVRHHAGHRRNPRGSH